MRSVKEIEAAIKRLERKRPRGLTALVNEYTLSLLRKELKQAKEKNES